MSFFQHGHSFCSETVSLETRQSENCRYWRVKTVIFFPATDEKKVSYSGPSPILHALPSQYIKLALTTSFVSQILPWLDYIYAQFKLCTSVSSQHAVPCVT